MIVTGITPEQFSEAVAKAGVDYDENIMPLFGTRHSATRFNARVVLKMTGYQIYGRGSRLAPGQRGSSATRFNTGPRRRINAVCWHVYRDVLIEVFNVEPDARVYTALAKYKGRDEFYRLYPLTGDRNVGSIVDPVTMPELCECER